MTETDFDKYSEQSVHFFSNKIPALLAKALELAGEMPTLVDFGCGDGHLVWALIKTGHIPIASRVIGVDISPIRLQRFTELTGCEGILADGCHLSALLDGTVDIAVSTMVVEHVPNDLSHINELARLVPPGGWLYLSTVIKMPGAWYFRKAPDGRRVLDPTHLREYPSKDAVVSLVESGGFVVKEHCIKRLLFPIVHPLVRWLHAWRPIKDVQLFFIKPSNSWLEAIVLPIPRYRSIELLAQRVDSLITSSFD